MQRYRFKARSKEGALRKGVVEARNKQAAVEVLRGQSLIIVELEEQGQGLGSMFSVFERVKFDDVVNFTRQLSTMISAGLPLTDALSILEVQAAPAFRKKIANIMRSVEGGSSFADALSAHGDVFSSVYIALVRAGEAAGVIDTILKRLADNLEKQREFQAKTKGALIYPVIVLIGMVLVAAVMMIFVLPKLTVMYDDFQVELPLTTKILIGTSNFMAKNWFLLPLIAIGIGYAFKTMRASKQGQLMLDKMALKLPVMGKIREMVIMSEFARTLSLLTGAGVALVEALKIVSTVANNRVFTDSLNVVAKEVEKGNSLAMSLARQEVFPFIISQMVSVGEQTGKLDEILGRLADYFETESEHAIKNLSTAMEPVIMVILGIGVGFMIISIVVPIYNLTSAF